MEVNDEELHKILDLVQSKYGVKLSSYKNSYLKRRILSRMRRVGLQEASGYSDELRNNELEIENLLENLSINVTHFFRNKDVWENIRGIMDKLVKEKSNEAISKLKIWSAGCAEGREPYSLSILAMESMKKLNTDTKVEIIASDFNPSVLESAKNGIYEKKITADPAEELDFLTDLQNYVDIKNGEFRIKEKVKETVTFEEHDLRNKPPQKNFDLVLCRNVLIYLDSDSKVSVIRNLCSSLNDGGYLVIGKTESMPRELRSDLEMLNNKSKIFRKPL